MATDIDRQIDAVVAALADLPSGLRSHIERVAAEAADLAERWDVDDRRMKLAVYGHDLFRAVPEDEQIARAREAGVRVKPADRMSPVVLHGATAAAVLRRDYGVGDADVLQAIEQHTLGSRRMPLIAKILLLADKVERRKRGRDPAMVAIRKLAWRDLDLALLCWADWKWVEERAHGWDSHPVHWSARREWVKQHHRELLKGLR